MVTLAPNGGPRRAVLRFRLGHSPEEDATGRNEETEEEKAVDDGANNNKRKAATDGANNNKKVKVEDDGDGDVVVVVDDDIQVQSNSFVLLPSEALEKIVRFLHDARIEHDSNAKLGVRGLIGLAGCDRYLHRMIYREFSFLWNVVDLSHRRGLTDARLHAFLESIGAVDHVRVLRLNFCPRVTGVGLTPLMGSRVLERIDIKPATTENDNPAPLDGYAVSRILGPMLDSSLRIVNTTMHSGHNLRQIGRFAIGDLTARLRLTNARRLVDHGIRCSFCSSPFSDIFEDISTLEVIDTDEAYTQCNFCKKYSCEYWASSGPSSCPCIRPCASCDTPFCDKGDECGLRCVCGFRSCNDCNKMVRCWDCDEPFCKGCNRVWQCEHCKVFYCYRCWLPSSCVHCGKQVCFECIYERSSCSAPSGSSRNYCRFDEEDRCIDCGFWIDEYSEYDDEDIHECPYCLKLSCPDCHDDHICLSPRELTFGPRNNTEGVECNCGKNHLRNAQGQQFMCVFAPPTDSD